MCELCEYLKSHDLTADLVNFPRNVADNPKAVISYEFALFEKVTFKAKGAERCTRGALRYELPVNFCPVCGKKLDFKGD